MPKGLKRYYGSGDLHFITCSCYRRLGLLGSRMPRDLLVDRLEQVRKKYQFAICGYVVMPEHIHLLITEPRYGRVAHPFPNSGVPHSLRLYRKGWASKNSVWYGD